MSMPTGGGTAEARVLAAMRAALPAEYRHYPNVRWIHKDGRDGPARDGETDLVIVHPERGLLIVETKGGVIRRDGHGRWFSGGHALPVSPFEQAERSKHALVRKLAELPDWPGGARDIRAGHAVAFPDVELSTLAHPERGLGPDAPLALVADTAALATPDLARAWVEAAYDHWVGDGRRGEGFDAARMALIESVLAPPPLEIRSSLRRDIEAGEAAVVTLTQGQHWALVMLRRQRRAAVAGPAGCGKTMLAAEKARQLAREGFRTLLVCFNQPLARMLADELALPISGVGAPAGLDVLTFHELCLRLGRAHGLLPRPEPAEKGSHWFGEVLPRALENAIGLERDPYHAVIVDEGQDFARSWLESLDLLLAEPGEGVLYVFHDPGQALFREDEVGLLGLPEYLVEWNCRNPGPIHAYAARHVPGLEDVAVLRETGRAPELIEAAPGREANEALRRTLHRLVVAERVPRDQVVVLTGRSLARSDAWRQRRFGDQALWNGDHDERGQHLGHSADDRSPQPPETILFETIRRFKGLEREVVVLVELDPSDAREGQLRYVGATRARQHLVVIGMDPGV
jgi:hypothetical protein